MLSFTGPHAAETIDNVQPPASDDLDAAATLHPPDQAAEDTRTGSRRRSTAAPTEELPLQIGRYPILDRLGVGAMGTVFLGRDKTLERDIAIKLLHDGRSGDTYSTKRLVREAQAMARLSHANVVQVYEVGTHDDQPYVAMERIVGVTLRRWLAESARSFAQIVDVFAQIAEGLQAAHRAGIVHRDFKPDNVMVTEDGVAKVADFGISAVSMESVVGSTGIDLGATPSELTATGAILGTPAYMAPEQHEGLVADERSDQYAWCVACWEALFGQRPFRADSLAVLVEAVTSDLSPEVPPGHKVPRHVVVALRRGLSRDPKARWSDVRAAAAEICRPTPRPARRWIKIVVGTVVLTFGGMYVAGSMAMSTMMLPRTPPAECARSPEALAGVWDAGIRDRLATELGPATAALDAYAEAWLDAQAQGCTDFARRAVSRDISNARLRCLQTRRDALGRIVSEIADSTDRLAKIATLPRIGECAGGSDLIARFPEANPSAG